MLSVLWNLNTSVLQYTGSNHLHCNSQCFLIKYNKAWRIFCAMYDASRNISWIILFMSFLKLIKHCSIMFPLKLLVSLCTCQTMFFLRHFAIFHPFSFREIGKKKNHRTSFFVIFFCLETFEKNPEKWHDSIQTVSYRLDYVICSKTLFSLENVDMSVVRVLIYH